MGGTYVGWVSYSISLDSHDHGVRGTSKKGKGQVVEAYSIYYVCNYLPIFFLAILSDMSRVNYVNPDNQIIAA